MYIKGAIALTNEDSWSGGLFCFMNFYGTYICLGLYGYVLCFLELNRIFVLVYTVAYSVFRI